MTMSAPAPANYYIPGFGTVSDNTTHCEWVNGNWACVGRKKREAEPEPKEKREAGGPGDVNCVPDYGYNCDAQYPDYPVFGGCRWECFDYGCLEVC